MRQAQIEKFGGADELHVVDAPKPTPAAGEVLLRVLAAGTNPIDYKIRDGSSGWLKNNGIGADDLPLVLGREACGVVEAHGPGVRDFVPGQVVFGVAPMDHPGRCYAEYVTLPADALAQAPEGADPVVLGGLALAGSTAWLAVHELGRVRSGDKVLVHGGAGGVGQLVIQLAVAAGAEVWATASTGNQDRLRELGAHPIDYTSTDFAEAAPKVDVVVDGVYFDTFEKSLDQLVDGGRIVCLPTLADLTPAKERGIVAHIPALRPVPREMGRLAELVVDRTISLEVSQVLPLDRVADAHRELEGGHARGKIVLDLR